MSSRKPSARHKLSPAQVIFYVLSLLVILAMVLTMLR